MLDPFYKPVMTLIEPFIVHKYSERREDGSNPKFTPECRKSFDFNAKAMQSLLSDRNILPSTSSTKQLNCLVQLRCIAQNNQEGILQHAFPTFGHYRLHGL